MSDGTPPPSTSGPAAGTVPAPRTEATPTAAQANHEPVRPNTGRPVPRTRVGSAWIGLSAAAILAIAFIVFLAQNTGRARLHFLWMHANTSLSLALLIAAAGAVLLTLILGTARITQLRHLSRRRRR